MDLENGGMSEILAHCLKLCCSEQTKVQQHLCYGSIPRRGGRTCRRKCELGGELENVGEYAVEGIDANPVYQGKMSVLRRKAKLAFAAECLEG